MTPLDGPRLAPLKGPATSLVVFLHGYGADGNDLIDIGREWQAALPGAAFVSPHAPEPCAGAPFGRQWFALTTRSPTERWQGVLRAAPALEAFLAAELARLSLPGEALALVGFSQGTMMALHAGLRRSAAPGAIVGYSGLLIAPDSGPPAAMAGEIVARPPVLLVHGDQDGVIPAAALAHSADLLTGFGVSVESHLRPGLGHGIDGVGLGLGAAFLARHLPGAP